MHALAWGLLSPPDCSKRCAVSVVVENSGQPHYTDSFNVNATSAVSPSTPLGYASANEMRQIQFGARLTF